MQSRKPATLGLKTVTTAGTRVRVTSALSDPTAPLAAPWISIQAPTTNTGKVFVGDSAVSSTVYFAALSPGDSLVITPPQVRGIDGEYYVNDFYLDAATNGDKANVTYDTARPRTD